MKSCNDAGSFGLCFGQDDPAVRLGCLDFDASLSDSLLFLGLRFDQCARSLVVCNVYVFFSEFFVSHHSLVFSGPLDVTHLQVCYLGVYFGETLHHGRVDKVLEERATGLEFAC